MLANELDNTAIGDPVNANPDAAVDAITSPLYDRLSFSYCLNSIPFCTSMFCALASYSFALYSTSARSSFPCAYCVLAFHPAIPKLNNGPDSAIYTSICRLSLKLA